MNAADKQDDLAAAVIPAFNEAVAITGVIERVSPKIKTIVIDDGSTDDTAVLARSAGADVFSHSQNLGYDRAVITGLRRAHQLGYDFAVTLDGDGQHNANLLASFVEELEKGADLVVGVRDNHQRVAETIFAIVAKFLWGIQDPLCGMKGYRLGLLNRIEKYPGYDSVGTELAIRAAKSRCRIVEIPLTTEPRIGKSKFGQGFAADWKILRALFSAIFKAKPLK